MAAILYQLIAPNEKCYIGVTTQSMKKRIAVHLRAQTVIGAALRKYGLKNFKVETLVVGDKAYIYALEKKIIAQFDTLIPNGYNFGAGGEGGGRGYHTEESKRKIAKSHLGLRPSMETRQRLSEAHTGNCHSEETRRKMSESHRRRFANMTEEERNQMYGHVCSVETRRKLSEAIKQSWTEGGSRRWRP